MPARSLLLPDFVAAVGLAGAGAKSVIPCCPGHEPLIVTTLDTSVPELDQWLGTEFEGLPVGCLGLVKGAKRTKAVLAITTAIVSLGIAPEELAHSLPLVAKSFAAIHVVCRHYRTRREELLANIGGPMFQRVLLHIYIYIYIDIYIYICPVVAGEDRYQLRVCHCVWPRVAWRHRPPIFGDSAAAPRDAVGGQHHWAP